MVPSLLLVLVAALPLSELQQKAGTSVVHIALKDALGRDAGSGSGFVVSADGRIATNHHVIQRASAVTVTFADGREVRVNGVLAMDPAKDLAILDVDPDGVPAPLELGSSETLKPGDAVSVVGSPLGFSGTLSTGIVAAVRSEGLGGKDVRHEAREEMASDGRSEGWRLQITAAISPGSSGSPVLDADGRVVGVAVGTFAGGQSLNFAVPVDMLRALLAGIPPGAVPAPFRRPVWVNLLISAAIIALAALVVMGGPRLVRRFHRS